MAYPPNGFSCKSARSCKLDSHFCTKIRLALNSYILSLFLIHRKFKFLCFRCLILPEIPLQNMVFPVLILFLRILFPENIFETKPCTFLYIRTIHCHIFYSTFQYLFYYNIYYSSIFLQFYFITFLFFFIYFYFANFCFFVIWNLN